MKSLHRGTLAVASAITLLATFGTNTAQAANVVPGAETTAEVVITDSDALKVEVNAADAAATSITGKVTNTSDREFVCAGAKGKDDTAGDVAPADLVAKSVAYYQSNLYRVAPELPVKSPSLPLIGAINLGTIDLGSSQGALQGSGPLLGQANGIRKYIGEEYSKARLAGHAGLIKKFTIPAGEEVLFDAPLPAPTQGARTDFNAAAFLMCTPTDTQQPHVFAGFEEGATGPQTGSSQLGILGKR
ncbi:hypothetical protein [Corynebacterium gerontici]|uniref:Uncharacterized protein n=1 Tax=Corynebacterium gerontici TaxID=2079234 RepID=A0A3G6IYX1_9CORY|nr:hypothetical protein [Corynebacterium gerontici]AZA10985.1 hypothetical protein CGERO_03325 [Corynebacterium gerontici]